MKKRMMALVSAVVCAAALVASAQPCIVRERFIPANEYTPPRLVGGERMTLPVFENEVLSLTLGDRMVVGEGLSTFGATVEGRVERDAIVVQLPDGFIVTTKNPSTGLSLIFRSRPSGLSITERKCPPSRRTCAAPKSFPKGLLNARTAANMTRASLTGDPLVDGKKMLKGETHTNVIDILVGFDLSGSNWVATASHFAGAADPLRAFAADRVQNMNNALKNSGLNSLFSFALAGITVLEKDWGCADLSGEEQSKILDKHLDELTEGRAGASVRAAREECGADLVSFLIDSGIEGVVGLGYSLSDDTIRESSFGDYAFNICSVSCVAEDHTMTHECGHNMGAGHAEMADKDNSGPQLYDYSTGYYFAVTSGVEVAHYFTIMGYNDDGFEHEDFDLYDEAPYFSSPNQTFVCKGEDTHVVVGDEKHDNARLLSRTYPLVANYRVRKARLVLVAPDGGVVSGGMSAVPKQIVAIKAVAPAGMVFAGWYAAYDEVTGMYSEPVTLQDGMDYRTASGKWMMPADVEGEQILYARFVPAADDAAISLKDAGEIFSVNGSTNIMLSVESLSLPKATVKGLPTGMKFDAKTLLVSGTPTKPGVYEVQVSLTNTSVKKAQVETFTIQVPNFVDEEIPVGDAYGPFIPGIAYTNTLTAAADCTVSGLPSGFKWTAKDILDKAKNVVIPANSFYGAGTKPGNYTVYFTKTVNKVKHTATASVIVSPFPVVRVETAGEGTGKVTGGGGYPANKKVTLKATANKGSVFMGWYADETMLTQAASYSFTMPANEVAFVAKFITSAQDAEGITAEVNGCACEGEGTLGATNIAAGVSLSWPIVVEALSEPKVTVTGLPAGLKFTAKDIVDSKTKRVLVPAQTIYGAPTAASKVNAQTGDAIPSRVKIVVTTAGKSKREFTLNLTVDPLPFWTVGTFNGGGDKGQATLTIAATGKISGKWMSGGTNGVFTATSFDEKLILPIDDGEDIEERYIATVIGTMNKIPFTNKLSVVKGELGGEAALTGESFEATLAQNLWKDEPWKTIGKSIANQTVEVKDVDAQGNAYTLTLKFAANGVVTVKGLFSGYSATVSSVLVPTSVPDTETDAFTGKVMIYFPPKVGKFAGFVGCWEWGTN